MEQDSMYSRNSQQYVQKCGDKGKHEARVKLKEWCVINRIRKIT